LRFGLRLPSFALGPETASLDAMGAYLRRAEDLGFGSALLIDHLLTAPPAYRVTWLEPITLLAALSGVTRTMRLGTLVLVLPFRDPVLLAKEWATLDVLSGGRTILGVGVGWHEGEFEALRIPRRERGRRMDELLDALTVLWSGEPASHRGRYYAFEDLVIEPQPVQRPHPPIWIGGGTQPHERIYAQQVDTVRPVLERIARYADAWVPHSSATAEMVRVDWDVVQEAMVRIGRHPDTMSRVYSNFVHVLGPGEPPESAAARFERFSGMDLEYWQSHYLLGEAEPLAERIRGKIGAMGGVDEVILNPLDWDVGMLERLASEVLPLVDEA
jgi:probable F420-dependent oxidoreductase